MRKLARLCVLSLGLAAVPVAAQNTDAQDEGGGFLENLIEDRLSSEGFQVQVRGFQGALSSRATIERITIADAEGVWLTINDAVLDWNRSALLRGRLSIEELAAEEILLPRLPKGEDQVNVPQPEAQPFSLPELPVSINIGQINAERIELGQPVIGEEAVITLEGSAQLANGEGQVDVRAERIDDERGIFQVAGSYENSTGQLEIDVELEEGPDGIVANLIDLPGRPALSASVQGAGPISDFTADIDLDTDGEDRLDGTISLQEVDGANSFAVDLSGDVTALFAPSYRPFFGPNVSLEAQGARFPNGAVTLDQLSLRSQALNLQGEVRIGPNNVPTLIDVTGEIASEDGSPVLLPVGQEIRVNRVGLDVNFDASEGDEWSGEVVIEGLDRPGLEAERVALDGSGIISGSGETLEVEAGFDFAAAGLSLDDGGLEAALGNRIDGRIELSYATGEAILLNTLNVTGAGFALEGSGEVDPDGENLPVSFTGALDAEDLSVFAPLVGRPLDGGASLDVDLTAEALSGAFDVSLEGRAQELEVGIPQLDPLLSGSTLLDLEAVRNEVGLNVERLVLQNEQIEVAASAAITSQGGAAELEARVEDLSLIDPTLSGPATLIATAERPADVWQIDLEFQGAEAVVTGEATIQDLEAESPLAVFDLAVVADDLANFGAILDRPLGGAADLSARGQTRLDLSNGNVVLDGTTTDIEVGREELDCLLSGETEIGIRLRREGPQFTVPNLAIRNPQIAATADGFYGEGQSAIEARILLDELGDVVPEMSGPAEISLVAREDADGWEVDFDATGAGARVVVDGAVEDLRTPSVSPMVAGVAEIEVDDLGVFSSIVERELGGALDLSVTGGTRFDLSEASVEAEGTSRNLEIGIEEVDRLLSGVTELRVDAAKDGDVIDVEELLIQNPQITVSGSGDIAPGDSAARLQVQLDELGDVIPEMRGPAVIILDATEEDNTWVLDLDATGAGARVVADATVEDLRTEGVSPLVGGTAEVEVDDLGVFSRLANRDLGGAVDVALDGRARLNLSEASVEASGTTRNLAIGQPEIDRLLEGLTTFEVAAEKNGDTLLIEEFQIENPQITAVVDGSYGGPGANALQAEVTVAELSDVVPELRGSAELNLVAEQTGDTWQVALDGEGAGVTAEVLGEISDLDATPVFDGRVALQAQEISRFSRLAGRQLSGSVNLQAEGEASLDASRFDVTATGRANNLRVGVPQVDQLLSGGPTSLSVAASRSGASAPIQVQRFQLDAPGFDAEANGTILGGASNLSLDARLDNLGTFVPNLNGPLTAQGRVGQSGSNLTLDVALTGPQGISARVDGTVAESFDQADIDVTGDAPLRLVNPFLGNRTLSGSASYDLSLNGPLALSSLTGTVTVEDGRLVDPTVPFVLNDIDGTARLQGDQVVVNATAAKQEGGTLALAGTIGLDPGFPADLGIEVNRVVHEDPRLYRTIVNGRVTLTGPLTGGAVIGGTLLIGETEIRIPSTGLGASGPIPDGLIHENATEEILRTLARADLVEEDRGEEDDGPAVVYGLDLTILAEDEIFIRGRGLDAELGGSLTLEGTTANVVPTGRFELIRGRIDLLGQRIILTEGYATLAGDFTPTIRLVAETQADDVTVRIIVEGEVTEPEITFSSDPELPEDEVLSRLLFGRSIENISALQAAQLANAVATLSGRGGIGIVESLRESTGLDDLDVTTDEEGNVGVQAGAYLSENVYSSVNVDSEGEAEINLNLDVTDSIAVRGSASNEGETSLGVFFERDY
ncbi:translocation/assembly module TamB domain-containing protein [Palleronia sp.]|uniref:translocation/assembly module TamB domain-containing protein n=1 Tax=Palleronia sp. TaxID=1940284 RepID=UPI0035C8039E